jgi:hypothetical protein
LGLLLLLCPLAGMAQAPDLLVCSNKGFTITNTAPADGTDITYSWLESVNGGNFTEVPVSDNTDPTLSVAAKNAAGTYSYVRVASGTGCTDVPSNTYTVAVLPPITPPTIAETSSICFGSSDLQFTIPTAANTTYSWNKKEGTTDGAPSGDDNRIYTVPAPAVGTYTLAAAASVTFNVEDYPSKVCVSPYGTDALAAVHPLPVISTVGNTAFCGVGEYELQVEAKVNNSADGVTVAWYTESSGSTTPVSTTTSYTTADLIIAPTTWYVRATTANGCSNSPLYPVEAKLGLDAGAIAGTED